MNKTAVVVDSGVDLPPECHKENVFILPLKVIRDGVTFLDGVTIMPEQVIEEIDKYDYKTSLSSPGEIIDLLTGIKDQGFNQAIIVTISSGLSGIYNAFCMGSEEVDGLDCEVIDTLSIGIGAGLHAVEAIDLIDDGVEFKEAAQILRSKITESKVYFCVGVLDYLIKGGRIGKVSGYVGKMLNLKPVITCDFEGIYSTVAKVRGQLQAVNKIIDLICENFKDYKKVNIGIANCCRPEEVEYVKKEITKRLTNINKLFTGVISPALTVHTGPHLIGITAYPHV